MYKEYAVVNKTKRDVGKTTLKIINTNAYIRMFRSLDRKRDLVKS